MKTIYAILLFTIIQHSLCCAQTVANIEGTWKGTSLCQVKSSPCHDEEAVYHISKVTDTTYSMQMNKIVNGAEEEMGPLAVKYDQAKQTLSGKTNDRQGRDGVWTFKIDGDGMHGTLTLENTLFRIIELKKG